MLRNWLIVNVLARILRILATSHIFTEVVPDIFCDNRVSSALDTGKGTKDLLERYCTLLSVIVASH